LIPVLIVPVLTRHDLLTRMIKSINYPVKDLLIIDNDSQSNYEIPWNQWVNKIWYLKMPANLGVAGSWNLGIKSFPYADYWLICNFDVEWAGDSLQMFYEKSKPNKLILSGGAPEWCVFSLGWQVVNQIGLFDESLHPAYFEDNDYERRCKNVGIEVEPSFIPIAHDNSSTINAGYRSQNDRTYSNNEKYYMQKVAEKNFGEGQWNIKRRKANGWED
jgi:GT2 family glycosyltransferase